MPARCVRRGESSLRAEPRTSIRMNSASSSQRVPTAPILGEGSDRARAFVPGDAACDPDQPTIITQRPPGSGAGGNRAAGHLDLAKQLAGERLNHFQLLEYVGGGGMGAVFRALDTMLNRDVALKVLSRDQGADDETRRRFQNEAQSAARLDHENIARVFYVGEDRGLNYIVFEFIEGTNLRELVERKGPLPLPEALSYTLQIVHALSHAASRDVVHRDIKPSNVLITSDGRAKLVDMGLARLHHAHPHGEDLTASGVTLGTFDYISPEQARDPRCADVRSDIYSLGCTLYYMLTGRPPFPEGTVLQKLLQHNSDAPPDPRDFDPALPAGVSLLVAKMLAKDPLRRYQRPEELMTDILSLADQAGFELPGSDRQGWSAPAHSAGAATSLSRHLPWMTPIVLLLLAAGVAGWPLSGNEPSDDLAAVARIIEARSKRRDGPLNDADGASVKKAADDKQDAIEATPGDENRSSNGDTSHDDDAATTGTAKSTGKERTDAADVNNIQPMTSPATSPAGERPMPVAATAPSSQRPVSAANDPTVKQTTGKQTAGAPPAEPIPEGLLIVGERGSGPRRFATLAEACAAAKNSDVIELRYDGPREEPPLNLHNLRIEIRAGVARRPAVVFRPNDTNPIATDRTMITVAGGNLKVSGIDVELDLSRAAPSENWSLFAAAQCDGLRLEQCSLTIRNATPGGGAFHDKVAFFNVGGTSADPMELMPKGMPTWSPVQIWLNNCLVRGEADLLVDRDLKPASFWCGNGLIAISERLFAAGAGAAMPPEGTRVRIELDHVTALTRQGLCRIAASEAAPAMPEVEVRLSDSLVLSDAADPALVEHMTDSSASRLQTVFHWEAVNCVYGGFSTFWKIGLLAARPAEIKSYSAWVELWSGEQDRTRAVPLMWRLSPRRGALNAVSLADFSGELISQDLPLPVSDGANGRPGADFALLPAEPKLAE